MDPFVEHKIGSLARRLPILYVTSCHFLPFTGVLLGVSFFQWIRVRL